MSLLLVAFVLITLPFFTYYVSTQLFYRKANRASPGKRPPTIPYFIPGAFHAFTLAYEGPQKYFATLIEQYGNFAPFVVKAGSRSLVILRDPRHLNKILQAPTQLTSVTSDVEMAQKLFGAPKNLLSFYGRGGGGNAGREAVSYAHLSVPQKHLTGTPLSAVTDVYISILSANLNDKMFQIDSWTQIEDFLSFFQQVITRCSVATLFGSEIFKQYPSVVKDYQKFADAIDSFGPGLPRFIVSTAYEGHRDQLLQGIEKWLKVNHSGSEFAKIGDEDPLWDEHKGSKYIQERDNTFAKVDDFDLKDRAAEILGVMTGSNSSLLTTTFWTIVEILRKPHVLKHITAEISRFHSPQSGEYDIASITDIPLVQSVQAEIRRLRSSTILARTTEVDNFQLDEKWTLPKGVTVMLFSHDFSMNAELWAKARPRTVEKPLDVFWAERFLVPNRVTSSAKRENQRHKVDTGRFSLEGLEPLSIAFDNDPLGSDYMKAIQAATLAVLLTRFELQLCDPEAADAAMPPVRESAYGIVKPLDNIPVRIRKRRIG
ncbi:cytochrome P450 [Pyrenochaeta sp. MPI-SDFR-AT-0127]|nr:cytochrome P450 [Pyrenochaeta sp. MPI-SDFR-AT-0127]